MRQGSQSAKLTVDCLADAAAGLGICWNQRISKTFENRSAAMACGLETGRC